MKTQLEKLEEVTAIATGHGNYNCNAYMHGMANGLILARSIMKDEKDVPYLDSPKEWLDTADAEVCTNMIPLPGPEH